MELLGFLGTGKSPGKFIQPSTRGSELIANITAWRDLARHSSVSQQAFARIAIALAEDHTWSRNYHLWCGATDEQFFLTVRHPSLPEGVCDWVFQGTFELMPLALMTRETVKEMLMTHLSSLSVGALHGGNRIRRSWTEENPDKFLVTSLLDWLSSQSMLLLAELKLSSG